LGLLLAGVSITAGFMRLLPRWVVVCGLAIAVVGEISWITSLFKRHILVPLTSFGVRLVDRRRIRAPDDDRPRIAVSN
jgi:hypothetical protein